ncbi:MAG: hypothetical protein IT294_13115 [Deltaproteobacteria bacterium]|nr:hypothetical protein [Deltaproteobacteria bacterium]
MLSPPRSGAHRGVSALTLVLLALVAVSTTDAASTCATDCAQTACSVGCDEGELRDAVAKANDCAGNAGWRGRTITVDAGAPPCTIAMRNDVAAANAYPNSSCANDPEAYALCLTNDGIRIRGGNATFEYVGAAPCRQCVDECPAPQPALFTLHGNGNALEDFTYRYFPEGLHVRTGNGHTIARVTNDRICEDALTLDATAGVGNTVADSTFAGNQPADPGHVCLLPNDAAGLCGTDKALQLNGGGVTVVHNTITTISQPVHAQAGEHVLLGNTSTGSPSDDNLCQSYTVTGPAKVTMASNVIDHCKFGVRVDGGALVIADGNIVTNPWVAAFDVRAAGRLRGAGNRLKTRAAGFTTVSSVQLGLVVARNDGRARIDLGGGDFAGLSVEDGLPCASGGACSIGGNRFCSSGRGAQVDVWNVTDCPCLNQLCGGALGNCTSGSCAPLAADGTCEGSGGGGASIGARDNCFRSDGGALAVVRDAGASTTATGGAAECAPDACDF